MADLLRMVAELLRINCNIVNCNYSDPLDGVFYLIILPSALLFFFVWLVENALASKVDKLNHKIQFLIIIVVYIFIIINGYFTTIVAISQLWVYILLLGGAWLFIKTFLFPKGKNSNPKGGLMGVGALMGTKDKIKNIGRLKKAIERKLDEVEGLIDLARKDSDVASTVHSVLAEIESLISELKREEKMGTDVNILGGSASHYDARLSSIYKKMKEIDRR